MRLRALRGATTVEENAGEAIVSATEELLREVIERNGLEPADMVSCISVSYTHLTLPTICSV